MDVGRLRPLRSIDRGAIPVDDDLRAAAADIRTRAHLGLQYGYLSQLARDLAPRPPHVEMAIEWRDPPIGWVKDVWAEPHARPPRFRHEAAQTFFGHISFPLLHLTNRQMLAEAQALGFADLLQQTVFCHTPILGRPCGACALCEAARVERGWTGFSPLGRPVAGARRWLRRWRGADRAPRSGA